MGTLPASGVSTRLLAIVAMVMLDPLRPFSGGAG
jgi:hypothetical protein